MENTNLAASSSCAMPMAPSISITESAASQLASLLAAEPEGTYFRIAVNGGGCSGFSLQLLFDQTPVASDDRVFSKGAARVVVDEMSLGYLKGAELNYKEDLGGAGFEIKNPNSTGGCGCGKSFSM